MNSKGGCIRPQFVAGKGWLHLSAACGWEGVASQQLPRRGGASRQLPRRRRGGSSPAASKAEGFGVDFHILFGLNSVGQNPPQNGHLETLWSDPVVPPPRWPPIPDLQGLASANSEFASANCRGLFVSRHTYCRRLLTFFHDTHIIDDSEKNMSDTAELRKWRHTYSRRFRKKYVQTPSRALSANSRTSSKLESGNLG